MSTKIESPIDPSVFYHRVTHSSPYPMAVFEGPEHALRYANPAFWELAEQEAGSLLGKPAATCLPKCPGCTALLSRVSDSGQAEQHTEGGYSESWSYAAWPISTLSKLPVSTTMLLVTETSELHRRATMINEALLVSAVEQNEIVEVTKASAHQLSSAIVQKEEELDRSKEELRLLAFQLLQAQEDERRRIARELHDSFSQQLASLGMQMFHLEQEVSSDARHRLIAKLQSQLEGLANQLRALSHQLHPPALEHLGLTPSLRGLQAEFESNHSIPIRLLAEELTAPIPLQTATTLYRIVQESLWNVVKHAGKETFVTIELRQERNQLMLLVEDNGPGFDPERVKANGRLGLISMQERARLVGGGMTIESAPGKGTRLQVRVPVKHLSEIEHSAFLRAADDAL